MACERERLLREATALLSDPDARPRPGAVQRQKQAAPPRGALIQQLWREQTALPLFEDVVRESHARTDEERVLEYLERRFHTDDRKSSHSHYRWDEETQFDSQERSEEDDFLKSSVVHTHQ